jgi:hypothetical protein
MKTSFQLSAGIALLTVLALSSCKKENPLQPPIAGKTTYPSVSELLGGIAPVMQVNTVDAVAGGSFTSPQGTKVSIPPNAFVFTNGAAVTGTLKVEFKDLYRKSDMLFADAGTVMYTGAPLKSGGEFFIRVSKGGQTLIPAPGKKVTVVQPLVAALDTKMTPFLKKPDTIRGSGSWWPSNQDTVLPSATGYVFSLYSYGYPVDSGSWCNSDNSIYFSAYPQTSLTLSATDSTTRYGTNVFLLFKNITAMVHVYETGFYSGTFTYASAPSGLPCTVVAVGAKNGVLYSSFTPITIGNNQTVNFTLSPTTVTAFKAAVKALD